MSLWGPVQCPASYLFRRPFANDSSAPPLQQLEPRPQERPLEGPELCASLARLVPNHTLAAVAGAQCSKTIFTEGCP